MIFSFRVIGLVAATAFLMTGCDSADALSDTPAPVASPTPAASTNSQVCQTPSINYTNLTEDEYIGVSAATSYSGSLTTATVTFQRSANGGTWQTFYSGSGIVVNQNFTLTASTSDPDYTYFTPVPQFSGTSLRYRAFFTCNGVNTSPSAPTYAVNGIL